MARLREKEKAQLLAVTRRKTPPPPRVPVRRADDFLAFANFASSLKPIAKRVRFGGEHWKL